MYVYPLPLKNHNNSCKNKKIKNEIWYIHSIRPKPKSVYLKKKKMLTTLKFQS